MSLTEFIVEDAALTWFRELGYAVEHGPQLAPGEPAAERDSFGEVVLVGRLRKTIHQLNPDIPEDAREEALRKVLRVATPSLVQTNRVFHLERKSRRTHIAKDWCRNRCRRDELAFVESRAVCRIP